MSWLKIDTSTPEKPEVLAITIAMGWDDPDLTVGKLLKVWRWFDQHTVEGNAKNVTAALLDRIIGVTGLSNAMASVGWLIIKDGSIELPNFDRHNGKTAKDRALTAKRVAEHKANSKGNAITVSDALPREEKRREEDKEEANASLSSAAPTDDHESDQDDATEPAGLPNCPHAELIALFAEALPCLPQPKPELWDGARAKAMRSRWRWALTAKKRSGEPYATTADEAKDFFRRFFAHVAKSDFLTGRDGKWSACDLGWLMKADNFAKVIQGNYDNKV